MKQTIIKFLVVPAAVGSLIMPSTGFAAAPSVMRRASTSSFVPTRAVPLRAAFSFPVRSIPLWSPAAAPFVPAPVSVPARAFQIPASPMRGIPAQAITARALPVPSAPLKDYIVVLKDDAAGQGVSSQSFASHYNLVPTKVFSQALKGFSTKLTDADVSRLRGDSRVRFISEDRPVSIVGALSSAVKGTGFSAAPLPQVVPTGIRRIGATSPFSSANGVTVAVIDTGIDLTHPDLAPNIIANTSCIQGVASGNDDHGHGSHVAGTIAARDNGLGVIGVAPQAKLAAVKVLNAGGSGSWSSVICGIDWVTAHAAEYNIKVANMSLGGYGTVDNNCGLTNEDALHLAICNSAARGVTYVVAAGNSASDSSTFVPAGYNDTLITVSALADSDGMAGGAGAPTSRGADDTFATFSNFSSSIVDLGAPGVDIYSTFKNGLYHVYSGTSMASPHVAGAAARYLQTHSLASAAAAPAWKQVLAALKAVAEPLGAGHTDPSGLHPEPVVRVDF